MLNQLAGAQLASSSDKTPNMPPNGPNQMNEIHCVSSLPHFDLVFFSTCQLLLLLFCVSSLIHIISLLFSPRNPPAAILQPCPWPDWRLSDSLPPPLFSSRLEILLFKFHKICYIWNKPLRTQSPKWAKRLNHHLNSMSEVGERQWCLVADSSGLPCWAE